MKQQHNCEMFLHFCAWMLNLHINRTVTDTDWLRQSGKFVWIRSPSLRNCQRAYKCFLKLTPSTDLAAFFIPKRSYVLPLLVAENSLLKFSLSPWPFFPPRVCFTGPVLPPTLGWKSKSKSDSKHAQTFRSIPCTYLEHVELEGIQYKYTTKPCSLLNIEGKKMFCHTFKTAKSVTVPVL